MNRPLLLSTDNKHKLEEFREILAPMGHIIYSPSDIGLSHVEVIEDGKSFKENACKKAKAYSDLIDYPVIADDSGLCIDALDGFPGIYSARFASSCGGYPESYKEINAKLEGKDRKAHFHCCICLLEKGRKDLYFEGDCYGHLLQAPEGSEGFGYDPIFFSDELGQSFASAGEEAKNRVSHRKKAIAKLAVYLAIK